ncbi:MAG: FAD-binding protein [Pedobacter sp.]|jgi:xylitol oxidase|nr:FAD-binding protein [Pedobacter sp.]
MEKRIRTQEINWAGNITFSTDQVYYPKTLEEVQQVVTACESLKALGSKHSFNTIADNTSNQISLKYMNKVVLLNKESNTVTVEAGARYGEFVSYLHEEGYALPNLASLPHITVVGACSTATHGSGINNGNLSTSVSAIEFVNAAGEVVAMSRQADGEQFYGLVVNLGALGVITKITLDVIPTFDMKQVVYRNLPMAVLKDSFDKIQAMGYSVSLFTNWTNKNINEVWIKSLTDKNDASVPAPELFGAIQATENLHPVEDQSAENVTEQRGVPGAWFDRLPHFKMGFQPSVGAELQSEYFVSIEHAYEAMMAIEQLHERISPHLFISEIRTIDADNLWMSPGYKQRNVAFHFTWKQNIEAVMALLPLIEQQLAPFNPRPHWGKLFTMSGQDLQSRYEKLGDFKQLIQKHDPIGKFGNDFLDLLY